MVSSLPVDPQLQNGSRALAGEKRGSPGPTILPQVSMQGTRGMARWVRRLVALEGIWDVA